MYSDIVEVGYFSAFLRILWMSVDNFIDYVNSIRDLVHSLSVTHCFIERDFGLHIGDGQCEVSITRKIGCISFGMLGLLFHRLIIKSLYCFILRYC